jgi:predicted O-methyltransferase YrrM
LPKVENVLDFAHEVARRALSPGAWAVDATAGNGHDTCALAEAVGPSGQVWAFDVQAEAIRATRHRLEGRGLAERVTLLQKGHETMQRALPEGAEGRVAAVTFNLGYLPGGPDKTRTTTPATTIPALRAAAALLAEGGILTAVCYPGHPGGAEETQAVRQWADGLQQARFRVLGYRFLNQENDPPRLLVVERTANSE